MASSYSDSRGMHGGDGRGVDYGDGLSQSYSAAFASSGSNLAYSLPPRTPEEHRAAMLAGYDDGRGGGGGGARFVRGGVDGGASVDRPGSINDVRRGDLGYATSDSHMSQPWLEPGTPSQRRLDSQRRERCLCLRGPVGKECKRLFGLAWPLTLGYVSSALMGAVGIVFVGHLGVQPLAAMVIANAIVLSTYALASGVLNAVNTLATQARQEGRLALVGTWLQVGLVWTVLLLPLVGAAWWFVEDILRLLKPDVSAATLAMAGEYAKWSLAWLWPSLAHTCLTVWLESIDVVWPSTVISAVFVPVSVAATWVLVRGGLGFDGLGLRGAPAAVAVTQTGQLLVLCLYVFAYKKHHRTEGVWAGWSRACLSLRRGRTLLRVGIPIAATEVVFDWQLHVFALLSAHTGAVQAAAVGVMISALSVLQPPVTAVYVAVSIRVGTAL